MNSVLVTGSSKRIGASIATSFALKGWNVGIHYNSSKNEAELLVQELQNFGTTVVAFQADFKIENQISTLIENAKNTFGSIDLLVSTVGVFPERKLFENISAERFSNTFQLNVMSHLTLISEYVKLEKKGRVITFGSIGSKKILQHRSDYSISKNAVVRLTEVLAKELAPYIQCNCICPGAIIVGDESEDSIRQMGNLQQIPMNRYGTVEDILDAVHFFSNCTPFITGQTLVIDGGQSL